MTGSLSLLMGEDDEGHATLVRRHLRRAGLASGLIHLRDGQEVLDYIYRRGPWTHRARHKALALLLDLNMPRIGGMEVLRQIKADEACAWIPVFVLTTTDNAAEVGRCYALGAAACLVKPVDYGAFADLVHRLAAFLDVARMPGEPGPPFSPTYGSARDAADPGR